MVARVWLMQLKVVPSSNGIERETKWGRFPRGAGECHSWTGQWWMWKLLTAHKWVRKTEQRDVRIKDEMWRFDWQTPLTPGEKMGVVSKHEADIFNLRDIWQHRHSPERSCTLVYHGRFYYGDNAAESDEAVRSKVIDSDLDMLNNR